MLTKLLFASGAVAVSGASTGANPIRRVVTLMQDMAKEITAEGEKEEELFKKFMCYCKNNDGALEKDAEVASAAIDYNNEQAKQKEGQKNQLAAELADHKKDRADAKASLAQATELRKKEKAAYDEAAGDTQSYIDATKKAVTALEAGKGGSFVQTDIASTLKNVVMAGVAQTVDAGDAQTLLGFLQGDYHSVGGEIIGILKNMLDEFDKSLGGIVSAEEEAVKAFLALKKAKEDTIAAATKSIETKMELKGKLAVQVAEHKAAAASATKELSDAQEFLVNLKKMCADKEADWETRTKERQDELAAIDEAIAILNDDDALDTFKAAIKPKEKPSFLQRKASTNASPNVRAMNMLQSLKNDKNTAVSLMAAAAVNKLRNKQGVDFSQVIVMIDDMVKLLKQEAKDDESTKLYCEEELRKSDAEQKETKAEIESLAQQIKELEAGIAAGKDKIEQKNAEVKALDESVAEATEQRTKENEEYTEAMALYNSAVALLGKAKNRLNKFYNPAQYKAPEEPKLTEEERILQNTQNMSFLQIKQDKAGAPPPPPETYGEHKKKGQKSNSVIALLDMLTNDLKKEMQTAEHEEKTAQEDYEEMTATATKTRKTLVKDIADTQSSIAALEESLGAANSSKVVNEDQLVEVTKQIADLHGQCDFILANFEERRMARETEIEGLGKAKSVLSGANFE